MTCSDFLKRQMLYFATQEQGRFMGENGPTGSSSEPMNLPCGASSTVLKADHLGLNLKPFI